MIPIERVRAGWKRASEFPTDKESVYKADHYADIMEFEQHRGKVVLDYGCGGGADGLSYLRRGCVVAFADVVHENVRAAVRRAFESGNDPRDVYGLLLSDSAVFSPTATGLFDVINANGVLHHIEEPLSVVREFHRLLKPEGLLYVMLYTERLWTQFTTDMQKRLHDGLASDLFEAFAQCTDGGPGVYYARPYTSAEGCALLANGGFVVLRVVDWLGGRFRTFKAKKQ